MDSDCYRDGGRLLADIGGANARFAIERAPGRWTALESERGHVSLCPGDEREEAIPRICRARHDQPRSPRLAALHTERSHASI